MCCGNPESEKLGEMKKQGMNEEKKQKENDDSLSLTIFPNNTTSSEDDLKRPPTCSEAMEELRSLGRISGPVLLTGLLYYSRSLISMLFLGRLGELELAGGSLSIGFANITGYSVISGLAMGMEPICSQSYGAKRWNLMGLTLQRMVLILLASAIPIALLWLNMERTLIWCGQDRDIARAAGIYITFSLPDLLVLAFMHPLRIFLRTQGITLPLAISSSVAVVLHLPINILMAKMEMGIAGVALAAAWTNLNMVLGVVLFLCFSGVQKGTWEGVSRDCLKDFMPLIRLAIPSCASVCLEWWWYEFMVILCGLLANPKATVASMGILIQMTSLLYIIPSSLSMGVSTRVGNELGANRPHKARTATIVGVLCALVMGIAAMIFAVEVRDIWASLFTKDVHILELTAKALPILGLCELGNCPQTTGCGVLRGSARPRLGANINLGSFYMVGMPVALVLGFVTHMGFVGLWLGLLAAQASCLFLMMFHLLRTDWNAEADRALLLTATTTSEDIEAAAMKTSKSMESEKEPLIAGNV